MTGRLTLNQGFEKVQRALKILADRGVEPQLGPLKSTLLQLDSTFSERDYGASSFREFIQRLDDQGHLHLRRIDQGYLVEMNGDSAREPAKAAPAPRTRSAAASASVSPSATVSGEGGADEDGDPGEDVATGEIAAQAGGDAAMRRPEEAMDLLRTVVERVSDSRGGKPMYVRHLAQGLRAADPAFDEQAYGFRTLTELVHLGQREGILRMQRDRQGAWRITAVGAAAPAAPGASPETAGFDTGLNGAAAPEGVDGEPGHEAGSGDAGRDRDPADEELAAGGSTIEAGSDAGKDTDSDAAAAPPAEGADDAPAPKRSRRRRSPATASGEKPARATKSAASGTRTSTRTPRSRASGTRKKATPED